MTDVVVSIRMPSSLVTELKRLTEQNHFKDLSEEIRSIVRAKCLEHKNPYASELEKLREGLSSQQEIKRQHENKQRLIEDISGLLKQLQNEK